MKELKNPANLFEEVQPEDLLVRVMELKKSNHRLCQACAAYIKDHLELTYSFADDESYQLTNLRVCVQKETKVPSITEIMPLAFFYENEMKELFGVNIQMIEPDYKNKLYRIEEETPFLPKEEKA